MKFRKQISAILAVCMLTGSCMTPAAVSAEEIAEPADIVAGDADSDGTVDVSDAVLIARFAAEDAGAVITASGKTAADVNADGTITTDDCIQILEFIAKIRPQLGNTQKSEVKYETVNLTKDLPLETVQGKDADEAFISSQYDFAANLLKSTQNPDEEAQNTLISPLSVSLALAMTANGAKGKTKTEMESVLGGELNMESLNDYYYSYAKHLTETDDTPDYAYEGTDDVRKKSQLWIANSIWTRNDPTRILVPETFLQTTKNYYNADFYLSPFDLSTTEEINSWVNTNTHGMINKLLNDEPDAISIMYLINAIAFEADWSSPYEEHDISEGEFTLESGEKVKAEFMYGEEYGYLEDKNATGFVKRYFGGKYSFAAVLPKNQMTVSEYISKLDAKSLQSLLASRSSEKVRTKMPKFKFDYKVSMKKPLIEMGMPTAFTDGAADFTDLNKYPTTFISDVLHKTFIQVDERGTRAGAVTAVIMADNAVAFEEPKYVYLDRPFIFMILDEETKLPVFIGYLENPAE